MANIPARFRELLGRRPTPLSAGCPTEPTLDPEWLIVEEAFTLAREHVVESLCAIGNGYVGSRGSLAEGTALSAPATTAAGVFNSETGLARLADWTHLSVRVGGDRLRLDQGRCLDHRRILDLRQGILWREWRQADEDGRITRVTEARFSSLADRHLLLQSVTIAAENYSGSITIEALPTGPLRQTTDKGITAAMAMRFRLIGPNGTSIELTDPPVGRLKLAIGREQTYRLDRVVALHTSRDSSEPLAAARAHAERAVGDVAGIAARHREAWLSRWQMSDVRIDGDPDAQRALRFAVYHLTSAANPEDDRVSIGARGLSGTAYKGHVFWDTDIFMLPFFTHTYPEAARALVMYRYHTLAGARAKAARLGYRGALYAWESTDSGEDVTPPFVVAPDGEMLRLLTGEQEQHISADVAYSAWQYWQATGDDRFLLEAGAEILIETARFWASRVAREGDGRYHIRRVIGPDEYHETVDDNAYTNGLAQWNLETAAQTVRLLEERWPTQWQALSRRLGFAAEEHDRWLSVAHDIYTGLDERTGLIEQFRGYFDLEDIDPAAFAPRTAPLDMLLGRERIRRTKIIKQADVVMLIYLLWERFPPEVRKINFEYYEPRCGHGSSLSPSVHALVAARLGKIELAERYFRQAAEIDLANNLGNAAGGIHAAALGGLWQAAVFGFAGLHFPQSGPEHHANLPPGWRSLSTRFQWRGQWHEIAVPGSGNGREKESVP